MLNAYWGVPRGSAAGVGWGGGLQYVFNVYLGVPRGSARERYQNAVLGDRRVKRCFLVVNVPKPLQISILLRGGLE